MKEKIAKIYFCYLVPYGICGGLSCDVSIGFFIDHIVESCLAERRRFRNPFKSSLSRGFDVRYYAIISGFVAHHSTLLAQ